MKWSTLAIFVAVLLSANCAFAQNVLTNGSFEWPVLAAHQASLRSSNNTLVGWTIGPAGSLYLVRPLPAATLLAAEGSQYVDVNGAGLTLSQSFPTVTGEVYELSFSVGYYQGPLTMQVSAAVRSETGELLGNLTVLAPQQRGWGSPSRFRFIATTPRSTLTFTDTNSTVNYDLTLDNVSVERVTPRLSIACSHVRICWESFSNHMYQLQYRSDFRSPWIDFGDPIPGTGGTNCVTEEITDSRRFFRAVALP